MRKAVFIFGSAGSGKTTVARLAFSSLGFKIIDSDVGFQFYLKKYGLSPIITDDPIYKEIRYKGGDLIIKYRDYAVKNKQDVVLITTGQQYDKIIEYNQVLVNAGYDIKYIWVKIDKELALLRNNKRERVLPEHIFNEVWQSSEDNIRKLPFPIVEFYNDLDRTNELYVKILKWI